MIEDRGHAARDFCARHWRRERRGTLGHQQSRPLRSCCSIRRLQS